MSSDAPGGVLIIGAGASGLVALKECLHEGLDAICFEACSELGGLWRFTEEESNSSVYRSTVINTCKEMMSYSDFPIGADVPPFLHNTDVVKYFKRYAEHFNLLPRVQFDTRIDKVTATDDHATTGNWSVTFTHGSSPPTTRIFTSVLVCAGHHSSPLSPTFPGQSSFAGRILHSHAYKDPTPFANAHVAVVGIGNSGLDVSVEVSRVAAQTYLSTRSGAYIFNRLTPRGAAPMDYSTITRFNTGIVPSFLTNAVMENVIADKEGMDRFGIRPKHRALGAHPSINGEFFGRAACGAIITRPNIREIRPHSIIYDDGREFPCDALILATGYEISFPFLDQSCGVPIIDNHVGLYKHVFPARDGRPSLAFIGLIQPWGAIMPISELQARWAAKVLAGKMKLPSGHVMKGDVEMVKKEMKERYVESKRHTIQVDYVPYCDMIGGIVGCTPRFWPLFLKDPQLAIATFFRGAVPYTYRLVGPDTWPGARQAIMDAGKNMMPRDCRTSPHAGNVARKGRHVAVRWILLFVFVYWVIRRRMSK